MKVKLSEIKVAERFRSDYGDVAELAKSINQFGLIHPIVVMRDMRLVAGERRLRAHQMLQKEEIEVRYIDDVDEITKKEIELEENLRRKEFTWQEEVLAKAEIHRIKQLQYGAATQGKSSSKWGLKDTANALDESIGGVAMDIQLAKAIEVFPSLAKEKSKTRAYKQYKKLEERLILKEIARQRAQKGVVHPNLVHGDGVAGMAEMDAESVDLIVTDPPWGIGIDTKSMLSRKNAIEYEDDKDYALDLMRRAFVEMYRVLKNDSHCYVFFGISLYAEVLDLLRRSGFGVDPIPLVWYKGSAGAAAKGHTWPNAYESAFFAWKGARMLNNGTHNVLPFTRTDWEQKIHSAEKPVDMLQALIENSSYPEELVLDPFAGSASTLRAARKSRRRALGFELDEANYIAACEALAVMEDEESEDTREEPED